VKTRRHQPQPLACRLCLVVDAARSSNTHDDTMARHHQLASHPTASEYQQAETSYDTDKGQTKACTGGVNDEDFTKHIMKGRRLV
jgi:hypothetical protein